MELLGKWCNNKNYLMKYHCNDAITNYRGGNNLENNQLKRSIGFLPGIAILVGFVIGASIFIVPGGMASKIGPGVWLSYAIAGLLAFTVCFVYAQIGSVLPVSGANYNVCSLTMGGYGGFLYIWFYTFVVLFLCPAMALGVANYLTVFFPGLNLMATAVGIVVLTGLMNLMSTALSARIQTFAIAFVTLVIVIFGAGGLLNANWSNFVPMFPVGVGPVVAAVLTCYFSFTGFNALTEMSGEIINPGKNIPRIVFTGFAIIMVLYIGVCVALVALVPAPELGIGAPMVHAAASIFNGTWFGTALALAAICGAWTTLNVSIMSLSRDFYTLGKSGILPTQFTKVNRHAAPHIAIATAVVIAVVTVVVSQEILKFINLSSIFFMLVAIQVSVASLRFKTHLKEQYEKAEFKLKGPWYYIWPILTIVTTGYFLLDFLIKNRTELILAIGCIIVSYVIYYWRRKSLEKNGIIIDELIRANLDEDIAS